ncbi:MAG: diguanylate cyclase [Planctomycetia bacterium]|nr:diguanylate cyclase [Planctomycetia bacterium]
MDANKCSLLVVDDEPYIRSTLAAVAAKEFEVLSAASAEEAQRIISEREIDIILADQMMPGGLTGVQLLEWVRQHSPHTMRLMMTGLARLEDAVDAINCGQVHRYLFKPWRTNELMQILKTAAKTFALQRSHEQLLDELRELNQQLEARVQQRTWELEEANRQLQQKNSMLEKLALTDPLTGVPNRRAMDRLVRSEQRRRGRYTSPLALGLIDADHFREINTRYLLPGGDQVLIGLAQTLSDSVRSVDTVGRIGGEEFMVVAPETDLDGAVILAERIRSAVEKKEIRYKEHLVRVTVSIGFAVTEANMLSTYDQLKHVAAQALAEAKATGRNRSIIRFVPAGSPAAVPDVPTNPALHQPLPDASSDWVM